MKRQLSAKSQGGWGATEYLAVLIGLRSLFWITDVVVTHMREHHDEFSWTLMIPF